jgi:hypothetical protein
MAQMWFERVGIGVVVAAGLWTNPAAALEGDTRAGTGLGVLKLPVVGWGPALGVHGAYSVLDSLDVQASVWGAAPRQDGAWLDVLRVNAGLTLKLDVTEWVPYAGLELGGHASFEGNTLGAGVEPLLGCDFLLSRNYSFGVQYRALLLAGSTFQGVGHQVGLNIERRWGW